MTASRPDLRWAAKIRASAMFFLAGAATGTGLYFANLAYLRANIPMQVTNVTVTVANASVGCNGMQVITSKISTNGRAGAITYEWIRNNERNPVPLAVDATSGSNQITVTLRWLFYGQGTGNAVAEFRVLSPNPAEASITFPYSCRD